MDLERRLQRIEACESIRNAVYRYAMAGDRGNDASIIRQVFTQYAIYEAKGMGRFEGLEDIVCGLDQIARTVVVWSFHMPGGPLINLSDDLNSADVFWWVWVPVRLRDEGGRTTPNWGAGHYNAHMVDEGGRWKFARVLFETRLRTPYGGAWTQIDGPFQWPD